MFKSIAWISFISEHPSMITKLRCLSNDPLVILELRYPINTQLSEAMIMTKNVSFLVIMGTECNLL